MKAKIERSNIEKSQGLSLELGSEKSWSSIFLIRKVSSINEQFLTVNLKVKFVENGFAEEKVGGALATVCSLHSSCCHPAARLILTKCIFQILSVCISLIL